MYRVKKKYSGKVQNTRMRRCNEIYTIGASIKNLAPRGEKEMVSKR